MGRPDPHFDRRAQSNPVFFRDACHSTQNNVRSVPSLDLSTLFDETSETTLMDPKIMVAIRTGNETYLRNNDSHLKISPTLVDDHGNTLLHLAALSGQASIASYIIKEFPGLLMKSNLLGEVPLHVAARAGHLDIVRNLIGFIKDISCNDLGVAKRIYFAKNKNQDTALHVALKGKHMLVAFTLVYAEKSLSFVANKDGFSPLYLAIEAGQRDLVSTMCQETDYLSSTVGGRSIVHAALKAKRKDILHAILSKDASLINLRDEGRTSLSFGASVGYKEGFCYLFAQDRDKVYVSDDDGLFPIHMAAKYGHIQILEEIVKHCPGALELLDRDGQNILHVAAKHELTCKKTNYNGFAALDVAEQNIDPSYSMHQRLTWMALINAGAPKKIIPLTENLRSFKKPEGGKYKDRVNTLLLVATLVATMNFTAGFTLPGGYNDSFLNSGMAVLAKRKAFQVFLVCDTLAMYSSIITIIALIWAQLDDLSIIVKAFNIALPFLGLALTTMLLAFMAGTYAVVSHHPLLGFFVLGIGIFFLVLLLLLLVPYVSPNAHAKPFLRHILYYPYFLLLLAAGDNNNPVDVDQMNKETS